MGQTPEYNLPWPELDVKPQGPDGFKNLAVAIDTAIKGQRDDTTLTKTFTPTLRSTGKIQPYGFVWTARYEVRNGWCEVDIFGQMSDDPAKCGGGTEAIVIGLPVRARASIPYQYLRVKLGLVSVGSFEGWAQVVATSPECAPYLPRTPTDTRMVNWRSSSDASGGAWGTGVPQLANTHGVGNGNISIWGRYLV